MSILDDLRNAEQADSQGDPNFVDGNYEVKVLNLGVVQTKMKGPMLILQTRVVSSESIGTKDRAGNVIQPNSVGSVASYKRKLEGDAIQKKMALGDVQRVCCAVAGTTPDELWARDKTRGEKPGTAWGLLLDKMLSDAAKAAQPFRGKRLKVRAWWHPQKQNPAKDFTEHRFEPVVMEPEELAASRAEVEAAGCPKLS